jgi:PAS domain S-box-containing protein
MGIVFVDVDGRIMRANAFFQRMLGRSSEDLIGRKFEEFTHPEEVEGERASFQAALEEGLVEARFQKRYVRNDGQTIWATLSATICRDAAGKPQFVIGLVEDITERKRAEEDLRSSHEQFRALAARIEHVREEERAALARELHDELGQGLTALQIDLAWLDGHLQTAGPADLPVLRDKIAAMVPRAERLIETTQAISSTMRPGVLDDLGLVAAIEWLAADFEKRTGLACMATLPATDIALDLGLAVVLFRIVQEALTNVIRHAKATRVEIRLRATEGGLALDVEDNGRGITPQQVADPRSLGLFSMRERAAALGCTVDFRSEAGRGTTVSVRVPVGG